MIAVLVPERAPEKADTRTVDAKLIEQIWPDFTVVK